jgi:predicted secreted Zn-dependent protease
MSKYIPPSKRVAEAPPMADVTSTMQFPSLSTFSPTSSSRKQLDYKKAIEEAIEPVVEFTDERHVLATHPLSRLKVVEMTNQDYSAIKGTETFINTPKIYYTYSLPNFVQDDGDISEEYVSELEWDTLEEDIKDHIEEMQEMAYEEYLQQ